MRKYLLVGLAVVLAATTGVLIYQGSTGGSNTASGVDVTVTQTTTVGGGDTTASSPAGTPGSSDVGSSSSAGPPPPVEGRAATNVPMTKLAPGEQAPQFIIFSFDGAGSHAKWQEFMAAAQPTNSRINGFLTGLYLLADENKNAYTGPGHSPGKSSVGFGGTTDEIATLINDLNQAYAAGHEIGTHYNGHFCAGSEPSGNNWTTADWSNELDQFFGFLENYRANNPGANLPELNVPVEAIKGGRTQCLEGTLETLIPAWKQAGLTYDSSMPAPAKGVYWPQKVDGIWEFYMPFVYSPAFEGSVMLMDYNMWIKFNQGENQPETAPQLRQIVYDTYTHLYDEAYNGNRAPLLIANHFNNWNGNSFNEPTLRFMTDYCGKPNTYCATYQDVIAWMEMQDPAVLQQLLDQAPVAAA